MRAYELRIEPNANAEYDRLLTLGRSIAFDLGNHIRVLQELVEQGPYEGMRATHRTEQVDVYLFNGMKVTMFVAISENIILLTHITETGSEYEQALALRTAVLRATEYFS